MNKVFTDNGWKDYTYWQTEDKRTLRKINQLIEDICRNGNEGIGKPEPLTGNLAGYWSRRINDKDRLIYKIDADNVYVLACRYHYIIDNTVLRYAYYWFAYCTCSVIKCNKTIQSLCNEKALKNQGFLLNLNCGRWDLKKWEIRKYTNRKAFSVSLSCGFKNVFKGIGKYYFISSFFIWNISYLWHD